MTNLEYLLEKHGREVNSREQLCKLAFWCENGKKNSCNDTQCASCKFKDMSTCIKLLNAPHQYELSPQDLTMLSLLSKLNLKYLVRNKSFNYLYAFENRPIRGISGDWYKDRGDVVCLNGFSKSFKFIEPEDEPVEVYKIVKDGKVIE